MGIFSERLEAMIAAALQDGVLTDKERELLKKRVEKEGEDWDEVEMIIEGRLAEMQPATVVAAEKAAAEKTSTEKSACPVCGFIFTDNPAPEKCPICSTRFSYQTVENENEKRFVTKKTAAESTTPPKLTCPVCGLIITDNPAPEKCPICSTKLSTHTVEKEYSPSWEDSKAENIVITKGATITEEDAISDKNQLKKTEMVTTVQESPYFVVNGKEYKDVSIDEIYEGVLENATGLGSSEIISLIIPAGVKRIKSKAFEWYDKLKELVIPNSVESIEEDAFGIILSDMSYEKLQINCPIIPENAFNGAPLKEVIFGEGVKKIESLAFANCEKLKSITLPHSIIEIGAFSGWGLGAFQCCKNLKKVDLSQCENLESIGPYTFGDCTSLSEIDFSSCVSLKEFGGDALSDCPVRIIDFSKCKSLDLPWLTKTKNLEKVILPPGQKSFNKIFLWEQSGIKVDFSYCLELKQINSECFKEMDIKEIVIPDTVEVIKENAFEECKELKNIVMPASLKEIQAPLGSNMEQLKKVDFSKVTKLRVIPKTLFDYGCDKLKELVIPQGVVEIEDDAFLELCYLKKLFLPPSLTTMGDFDRYSDSPSYKMTVYCYSPHLDELEPLVYGWDDEEDDDYEDMDEEDMRELGIEPGKNNQIKTTMYVLPQYVDAYTAQRDAEGIPNEVLPILPIPDEYLYYYDN